MSSERDSDSILLGKGPPLEVFDTLPSVEEHFTTPKITLFHRLFRIFGPGVIMLGAAIGSGELLLGPNQMLLHGMGILWIVGVSILLQVFFNYGWGKWTLATGESPLVSFRRIGKWMLVAGLVVAWLGLGWPGWAATAATVFASLQLGRIPVAADAGMVHMWGYVFLILSFVMLAVGRRIARTLELFNWVAIIVFFAFFFLANLIFSSPQHWAEGIAGYLNFGYIPKDMDITMLGAIVGYAGLATGINLFAINYYRDKGYGAGASAGYLPALVGGRRVPVPAAGRLMRLTPENLRRFKKWQSLLVQEQVFIFGLGSLVAFLLPGLLITTLLPKGALLDASSVATYLVNALIKNLGPVGLAFGLVIVILVLVKSQICFSDMLVRNTTEVLWQIPKVREWAKEDIRRVYYLILIVLLIWVAIALTLAEPIWLIVTSANMTNLGAIVTVPTLLYLNRKLPKELRMSWPVEVVQIIFMIFCMYFFFSVIGAMAGIL